MSEPPAMSFASAASTRAGLGAALEECLGTLAPFLASQVPDVAFVFVSLHHRAQYEDLAPALQSSLRPAHLLGCTGASVIGAGHELEDQPGVSITVARLPGVSIRPFSLEEGTLPDLDGGPRLWEEALGVKATARAQFVLLVDPLTLRAEDLLNGLDFAFPSATKVGGLASGATTAGEHALWVDGALRREGAVGLAFTGALRLDALVAQGCRPLGAPVTITKCRRNVLLEVDGQKPMHLLAKLYAAAAERDRRLMRGSLFLGVSMEPLRDEPPGPGEFLVRNLLGRDAENDGLHIGAMLREGQIVQFHVRDAQTAREDLMRAFQDYAQALARTGVAPPSVAQDPRPLDAPAGVLLFSCLGRGRHLYGRPDHDTGLFQSHFGDLPLGGFFCNGEIGPVSGSTHIHGFTSCFGIFRGQK